MRISDWSSDVCSSDLVSLLSPLQIRRISVLGFAATLVLLAVVPLAGHEIKGATRWVSVAGVSMQPSEFAKPFFAVVTAWMFAEWRRDGGFPGHLFAIGLYLMTAALMLSQPDLGLTVVISAIWFGQFFLAGQIGRASCRERGCQYV